MTIGSREDWGIVAVKWWLSLSVADLFVVVVIVVYLCYK